MEQFLPSGALSLFVRQLFDGLVIGEQVKLTLRRVVAETSQEACVRLLAQQLVQQQAATDAAQKYCDLAITRYRTGVDSYLDVFTAQTLLLTQQQTTLNLRVQ